MVLPGDEDTSSSLLGMAESPPRVIHASEKVVLLLSVWSNGANGGQSRPQLKIGGKTHVIFRHAGLVPANAASYSSSRHRSLGHTSQ